MLAHPLRSLIRALAISCVAAMVLALTVGPTAAREVSYDAVAGRHAAGGSGAAGVVADWNVIALRTIFPPEGATPIPAGPLYLSFASVAMYDAVVSIKGGFEPYALKRRPPHTSHASTRVAAATAAYTVLKHYFPASAANLDSDYAAALAQVADGEAKDDGIVVGQAAAQAIIALRVNDGRDAAITLPPSAEPGRWRPTPPAFAPMAVPWLGFVRPMVLRSPTQIALSGPDELDSARYTRDFREVKAMGAIDSAVRTPAQTQTALFWNDNAVVQYQASLRGVAAERDFGLVRSARMFALVNTSMADSLIACWRAKYDDPFWRPITAIRLADTDGNPATQADPAWTPLAPTPPYPEYPSGHACITGSVARGLRHILGSRDIDIDVSSVVTGTSRHYDTTSQLNRETKNARIWLGFHFRRAMNDGNLLGRRTASYVAGHEFERVSHRGRSVGGGG